MNNGGYAFMLDNCSKMYNFLYINGWFHHKKDLLEEVHLRGCQITASTMEVRLPHEGIADLGENRGFRLQILMSEDEFPEDSFLEFITASGKNMGVKLSELIEDRLLQHNPSIHTTNCFLEEIRKNKPQKILDIGGRDRSKVDISTYFGEHDVTVFDILPGENVDVVGDAHELSKTFPPETFDAVMSVSVFEHLVAPWKCVVEINKVLKTGGIGLIHTHQTLGLHDLPWDFWRFSSEAWKPLFNKKTGFEIIEAGMGHECFILPFLWRPDKIGAEKSAGYESSTVFFRKLSETSVDWDVGLEDVVSTMYPDTPCGPNPDNYNFVFRKR